MIKIEVANQQTRMPVNRDQLTRAARMVLGDHGAVCSQVSIAVVDAPTIHRLNRKYLQHDYPTDVLSFVLEQREELLEGEVVVSADMAVAQADHYGWTSADELLLYVIHGLLHLVGFDDQDAEACQRMRCAERSYLEQFGKRASR